MKATVRLILLSLALLAAGCNKPEDKILGRWINSPRPVDRGWKVFYLPEPASYDSIEFLSGSQASITGADGNIMVRYQLIDDLRMQLAGYMIPFAIEGNTLRLTGSQNKETATFTKQ